MVHHGQLYLHLWPSPSVEGGELFERIVDESSPLTEVDAMVFVRQICEGIQYMHQMYVLHLDLKVSCLHELPSLRLTVCHYMTVAFLVLCVTILNRCLLSV